MYHYCDEVRLRIIVIFTLLNLVRKANTKQRCQKEAFEHHHKHECLTFVDFLSEEPLAESFIERTDFRFVLRFLCMAKAGLLTEETMRDFFTAPIGNLYDFGPSTETSYRNLNLNMKFLAKSPVHEDSIFHILCYVS